MQPLPDVCGFHELSWWILHYSNSAFEGNVNSKYGFDCKEQWRLFGVCIYVVIAFILSRYVYFEKLFKNCKLLFSPDRAIVPSQVVVYSTKLILNNLPQMLFPFSSSLRRRNLDM